MRTQLALMLTTALLLAACGAGDADPKQTLITPEVKLDQVPRTDGVTFKVDRAVSLADDFSNLENFEQNLNIYTVIIKMPSALAESIRIRKLHENNSTYQNLDTSALKYEDNQAVFTDVIDLHEEKLMVQNFEYQLSTDTESLQAIKFSLKPDLVVVGTTRLSSLALVDFNLDIGTLFIETGSSLITEGNNLSIQAANIISKDGSIETLSEAEASAPAAKGYPGKSGGELTVKTNLLVGNLKFAMRGQIGGKGMEGIPVTKVPPQAASGRDSADRANCRFNMLLITPVQALKEFVREPCDKYCPQSATSGSPGAKGYPGNKGNTGAQGGASGKIDFTATKGFLSKLTVQLLPGAGGEGGSGGPGGAGGAGGKPGAIRAEICRSDVRAGPQGPTGDTGLPGAPGLAGERQKPTITINGKTE